MVHTILKYFTHFIVQTKTWIVISFSTKKGRNYNFTFAMAILLQTTNGSVPSTYLSAQLPPRLNLVSVRSCYLKFTSWSCFFWYHHGSLQTHPFSSEKISVSTSNGLLPAWAAPSPLIYTDVQVQHHLHQYLSCRSHHLSRYCIYSNFFLSLVFWL